MNKINNCPCNSGLAYQSCCGMYHEAPGSAPTAEALMRSRYCAFYLKKFDYIEKTQRLENDSSQTAKDIQASNGHTQWIKLDVLETEAGLAEDKVGMVSFSAHFKEGQQIGKISERSIFKRIKKEWIYVSGEYDIKENTPLVKTPTMNIGRNDPCHCGSGKKFKKCCF